MACLLTTGRTEPCSDAIGGLKKAYFIDFIEDSFTVSGGVATAINANIGGANPTQIYEYELLNDGNNLVENLTQDINAGTSTNEQVLTLSLKKQDQATATELDLILKARPVIVVLDRMGNYRVVGISDGTVTTGTIESGGAKAEFNGYNLTFTAIETAPAPRLDGATETAFLAVVNATQINP